MVEAKNDLATMNKAAESAGLSQCEWARLARVSRSKLSLAINGHNELTPDEISRCANALRGVLAARVSTFNQFLESGFSAAAA